MIDFLLQHRLDYSFECFSFSLVIRICTDLADGLQCAEFSQILILVFRFSSDLGMN